LKDGVFMGWSFTADSDNQLNVKSNLDQAATDFDSEITTVYGQIGSLSAYWTGSDYDTFKNNADGYKTALVDLSNTMRAFGVHFKSLSDGTVSLANECSSIIKDLFNHTGVVSAVDVMGGVNTYSSISDPSALSVLYAPPNPSNLSSTDANSSYTYDNNTVLYAPPGYMRDNDTAVYVSNPDNLATLYAPPPASEGSTDVSGSYTYDPNTILYAPPGYMPNGNDQAVYVSDPDNLTTLYAPPPASEGSTGVSGSYTYDNNTILYAPPGYMPEGSSSGTNETPTPTPTAPPRPSGSTGGVRQAGGGGGAYYTFAAEGNGLSGIFKKD
jgi:hypothetical protein